MRCGDECEVMTKPVLLVVSGLWIVDRNQHSTWDAGTPVAWEGSVQMGLDSWRR